MSGPVSAYRLQYLRLARQDARAALDYLARFYPSTPAKFKQALKKCENMLKTMPRLYATYEENPRYRRAFVLQYLVFFQIVEARKTVEIYRILHGSQDISKFLGQKG